MRTSLVLAPVLALFGSSPASPQRLPSRPLPMPVSIDVVPKKASVGLGTDLQASAMVRFSDGSLQDLTSSVTWASSDVSVVTVNASGRVTTVGPGTVILSAGLGSASGHGRVTVTPRAAALANVGLYVKFENRFRHGGYRSGEILHNWSTVSDEVKLQLDTMRAMGVNTITFELGSSDPDPATTDPCAIDPVLGIDFPSPAPSDLDALNALLDALQARGMKMWLRLVNDHMEEQPPVGNQAWLTATLQAVGQHPALDLVLFEGSPHGDPIFANCGAYAEPPLYDGPGSPTVAYVEWAIGLAMSLGMPARQLSAEAIVGDRNLAPDDINTTGEFTDGHFWWPLTVEKMIFDDLGLPAAERTYALSYYEHRKCWNLFAGVSCTDEDAHTWAIEALADVAALVEPGARVVASELGYLSPLDLSWNTAHAYESIMRLFAEHGWEGGSFWVWAHTLTSQDTDPAQSDAIKRRGVAFVYNPVEKVLLDVGGTHVDGLQNGSFEDGLAHWTVSGDGTAAAYDLTQEPGEPEVPWRGTHAMQLTTGGGTVTTATSDRVPVQPAIIYTITADLRFSLTDSHQAVTIALLYYRSEDIPTALPRVDSFVLTQSDNTTGFATFPVQFAPPGDASFAAVRYGVATNGSPEPATLFVDEVR
jgi:hypothetical protein